MSNRILVVLVSSVFFPAAVFAAMSSASFLIYSDSLDYGGNFSIGSSYSLQDTIGGNAVGQINGSSYEIKGGYQASSDGVFTISLDKSSFSLGSLSTVGQVASDTIHIVVNSGSPTGYSLSIQSFSGNTPIPVSDGIVDGKDNAVTTGTEEFGFSVTGTNAVFSDDRNPYMQSLLATSSIPVVNDQVDLSIKAVRGKNSSNNNFSGSFVLSAISNL
jgi:hypothetical protein